MIGHGLTLPIAEHSLMHNCISIYCTWLTSLSTAKPSVPSPVVDDPDYYAQIIFEQFCELFLPRKVGNIINYKPSFSFLLKLISITKAHHNAISCYVYHSILSSSIPCN